MKKLTCCILLAVCFVVGSAQTEPDRGRIEVELDPIAYALQGYSVHGIYVKNRIRTDLGFFGIVQPDGYGGKDGFHVHTKGVGMKVNYLLNKKETWFAGVGLGYSDNHIREKETGETTVQHLWGVGVHVGYRWFISPQSQSVFRNVYLAPWFSVDYNIPQNEVNFRSAEFRQQPFSIFPTVHIGYSFRQGDKR